MTKVIGMTGKSRFKRGLNALEARFQESAEPESAAIELAAQAKAGAFEELSGMGDAELLRVKKLAGDAAATLSWFKRYEREREACAEVCGNAARELRERATERERRQQIAADRRYGVLEASSAIAKLAEYAAMEDCFKMTPPKKVEKASGATVAAMGKRQLEEIVRANVNAIGHPLREIDAINRCVECLELAEGWPVADALLPEVRAVRDGLAANIRILETNERAARAELKRRADEEARVESMKDNMPEIVAQLEERVRQLEGAQAS